MKILVRGDKIKVTDSIKNYIETKMERLKKYFDNINEIKVTAIIRVKDNDQIIEVTIPTSKFTLRAEEKHNDLYAAIDKVIDKLERQIRKNKTRINNRYKKDDIVEFAFDFQIEEEENENKIIKRKKLEIKPMDEEEAMLQLELIDHDFFVFNNIDEECISVLYKRKDGNYGIINTK